jgi:hypothetical protein
MPAASYACSNARLGKLLRFMVTLTSEVTAELLDAMNARQALAEQLINKLLCETDQPEKTAIAQGQYHEIRNADLLSGQTTLSGNWWYDVHGAHCLFQNTVTGQMLEVSLGNESSPGNLDPYFFHQFLRSTESLRHLAAHFPRPFADMLAFFEELARQRVLVHLHGVEFRR